MLVFYYVHWFWLACGRPQGGGVGVRLNADKCGQGGGGSKVGHFSADVLYGRPLSPAD